LFPFKRGAWAARGQHNHFPGPQRRKKPFDIVTLRVAHSLDLAFLVYVVAARRDYFGVQRKLGIGNRDTIKNDFQITLAKEMARLLIRLEVSAHVRSTRENVAAKHLHRGQMAEDGIAHLRGSRRKIRLAHSAAKQSARRHNSILCLRNG